MFKGSTTFLKSVQMLRNNRIEYVSVGSLARNNSLEFYKYFFHHFDSFRLLENEQNCFYGERGWFPEGRGGGCGPSQKCLHSDHVYIFWRKKLY